MGKENKNSERDLIVGNKDLFPGQTNGCNSNVRESDTTDEDYQEFLSCLKNDGGYAIYTPESGIPLKYEEYAECSDDSEIVGIDKDPFYDGCFTPFIASRLDSIVCISSFCNFEYLYFFFSGMVFFFCMLNFLKSPCLGCVHL